MQNLKQSLFYSGDLTNVFWRFQLKTYTWTVIPFKNCGLPPKRYPPPPFPFRKGKLEFPYHLLNSLVSSLIQLTGSELLIVEKPLPLLNVHPNRFFPTSRTYPCFGAISIDDVFSTLFNVALFPGLISVTRSRSFIGDIFLLLVIWRFWPDGGIFKRIHPN